MLKEKYLLIIFIIIMFYLFILPIINKHYNNTDNELIENFMSLITDKSNNSYKQSINNIVNPILTSNPINNIINPIITLNPVNITQSTNPIQPLNNTNPIQPLNNTNKIQPLNNTNKIQPLNKIIKPLNKIDNYNFVDYNNNLLQTNSILPNNSLPININAILPDNAKMDTQFCSMACCGLNQWTPLMDPNYGPITQDLNSDLGQWIQQVPSNYVGSNFSCNNGNKGNGCVCVPKTLYNILSTHGGNL